MELEDAIKILIARGAVFSIPDSHRHLGIEETAKRLDCSEDWVRRHKHEFPNAWRMPGGELRFPESDVQALAKRNRLRRAN